MKKLVQPFTKWPTWLVVLGAALWLIYKGVYPDLNPQHLQLVDAAIWILTYLLGLIGIANYARMRAVEMFAARLRAVENRLGMIDTRSVPAQRPPREDSL